MEQAYGNACVCPVLKYSTLHLSEQTGHCYYLLVQKKKVRKETFCCLSYTSAGVIERPTQLCSFIHSLTHSASQLLLVIVASKQQHQIVFNVNVTLFSSSVYAVVVVRTSSTF